MQCIGKIMVDKKIILTRFGSELRLTFWIHNNKKVSISQKVERNESSLSSECDLHRNWHLFINGIQKGYVLLEKGYGNSFTF